MRQYDLTGEKPLISRNPRKPKSKSKTKPKPTFVRDDGGENVTVDTTVITTDTSVDYADIDTAPTDNLIDDPIDEEVDGFDLEELDKLWVKKKKEAVKFFSHISVAHLATLDGAQAVSEKMRTSGLNTRSQLVDNTFLNDSVGVFNDAVLKFLIEIIFEEGDKDTKDFLYRKLRKRVPLKGDAQKDIRDMLAKFALEKNPYGIPQDADSGDEPQIGMTRRNSP